MVPQDCQAEATELRARLLEDARHARRWNLGWEIAFGAASAGQLALALAEVKPFGTFDADFRDTLYVGAAKSAIGVGGHLLFPLRIDVPEATADACADRDALRLALAEAARRERTTFWLNHIGSIAVNLAGAIVLSERRSWQVGVASAALGYPVGLLSVYTAPRCAWHEWRVQASATPSAVSVVVSGQF
jgi:hypothetical protein